MNPTFISPLSISRPHARTYPFPLHCSPPNYSSSFSPRMALDPNTVGTGYAFLDSLKGVVIGPTINEIAAAFAGGTVGVMGTIITLEVRRQRVKERKQCPYCRGTGKLPCATCYTLGAVPCANTITAQQGCTTCQERGYLRCNHVRLFHSCAGTSSHSEIKLTDTRIVKFRLRNRAIALRSLQCQGDGRLIPFLYERAIRAQYEDYIYTTVDDYYENGPPYI